MGQHYENREIRVLHCGTEIRDIPATVEDGAGEREGLNSWASDDAFTAFLSDSPADFSWAAKRNERRRQQEAKKRQQKGA